MAIKIEGAEELKRALEHGIEGVNVAVPECMNTMADKLVNAMRRRAVFNRGYSTGRTRDSIHANKFKDRLEVGPGTDYAIYLEHGTRYMEAQPFVQPALNEVAPDFTRELSRLLEGKFK